MPENDSLYLIIMKGVATKRSVPFVRAFTLIELLVVIIIVGLIASIFLPVLGRAREGARRAMCANNLRQHGIAWYLYLDDHNDSFPKYGDPPSDIQCNYYSFGGVSASRGPAYRAERRPLSRYLEVYTDSSPNREVFRCPDDIKPSSHNKSFFDYYGCSYEANSMILMFGSSRQRPLSTITSPKSKVYLETCGLGIKPGHDVRGQMCVMTLFVDGHVAGPFFYSSQFDTNGTHPERPVYQRPNTTSNPYD